MKQTLRSRGGVGGSLATLALACSLVGPAQAAVDRRDAVVRAVENVGPAVVNISTEIIVRNPYYDGFDVFEWFFGGAAPRRSRVENSLGSGVIVDPAGFVLTNDHVVAAASRITVTLRDGRQVNAEVVGADSHSDLAVLKLAEPGPWPSVAMGRSDDLMIGETLIAIGNPFGLQNTVTVGVLSASRRTITGPDRERVPFADFLQTDAAINPGNSGGALLNIRGELVGINTQIVARAQNLGFAIPIDRARKVFQEIRRYGQVRPAWTGLVVEEIDSAQAHALGLGEARGLLVRKIFRGSPADEAGIELGDVVEQIGEQRVSSLPEYDTAIARVPFGTAVDVTLARDGRSVVRKLVVAAFPQQRVD
ncbi:MAG: trypsin-like peptidase domain-containing protein [Acidobacteriota bacterium]|nr:MAG: trypsin-like peptidase domain-containing protein [Acidobacteriota bacterium]